MRRKRRRRSYNKVITEKNVERIRKKHKNHRFISAVTFLMLLIYLSGYLMAFLNKPSIGIETIDYGTIDVPREFQAMVIREEKVVKSSMSGQPFFNYSHGDRVKKGSTICNLKNVSNTGTIENQIKKIDKDILKAQSARSDISVFQEDINRIKKNIDDAVLTYLPKMISGDISQVYAMRTQIETQMDMRNEIWITENSSSVSKLAEERASYANQLNDNSSSLTAQESGIVSLIIDGYEETITPESIGSITKEQINMKINPTYISKSKAINEDSPVFKIVTSNTWYTVAYVPNDICENWQVGDVVELFTEIDSQERSVFFKIKSLEPGEKEARVEFETDRDMLEFLDLRTVNFSVKEEKQKGLKIPNDAIVEKVLIKIPSECVMDSMGKSVVIKREGGIDTKIELEIKSKVQRENTNEYDYYAIQSADGIKLGDTILMGSGESTSEYKLSEVKTYKGVYVVNSSVAKFNVITIISQNSDYAIVKSDSISGLKVHDNIVSDAKNVEENDPVF